MSSSAFGVIFPVRWRSTTPPRKPFQKSLAGSYFPRVLISFTFTTREEPVRRVKSTKSVSVISTSEPLALGLLGVGTPDSVLVPDLAVAALDLQLAAARLVQLPSRAVDARLLGRRLAVLGSAGDLPASALGGTDRPHVSR